MSRSPKLGRSSTSAKLTLFSSSQKKTPGNPDPPIVVVQKSMEPDVRSVVWTCEDRPVPGAQATFLVADDRQNEEAIIKERLPPEKTEEYLALLERAKKEIQEENMREKQLLEDQQYAIVSKTQTAKNEILKDMRRKHKEENDAKMEGKRIIDANRKKREIEEIRRKHQEEENLKEMEAQERDNIRSIQNLKKSKAKYEKETHDHALKLQQKKIEGLVSRQEAQEITRRISEEARMMYLERVQLKREEKRRKKEADALAVEQSKMTAIGDERDMMVSRIRMGTFTYKNGKLGFYDDVRPTPVQWIQYEDEDGVPYYFDPIDGNTQRRMPQDADIRHHTDDQRDEYDAIHGEGAWDALQADMMFKDAFNRDEGYWDEQTDQWVAATGHYDENYEWVQHEGYTDDTGRFIKYAKIEGDLSFMV